MKQLSATLMVALLACSVAAFSLWRMPAATGDARLASHGRQVVALPWISVKLPLGVHEAFSVVFWTRLQPTNTAASHYQLSSAAHWCPEVVVRSAPDLLGDAGGHSGAGVDLTSLGGSLTVSNLPFAAYTSATEGNWPRGVATVAGASSNAITVAVGGTSIEVGPGAFNRNVEVGTVNSNVVVAGAGWARVGVSQTPCYRFFQEMDGVSEIDNRGLFTDDSIVTNELVMLTYRFRADPGGQIYQSNIGRLGCFNELSQVSTNAPVAGFSSAGIYRVGLMGPISSPPYHWEIFDARVFPRWLTDVELDRIHRNAVQEIQRRGIPQWK